MDRLTYRVGLGGCPPRPTTDRVLSVSVREGREAVASCVRQVLVETEAEGEHDLHLERILGGDGAGGSDRSAR